MQSDGAMREASGATLRRSAVPATYVRAVSRPYPVCFGYVTPVPTANRRVGAKALVPSQRHSASESWLAPITRISLLRRASSYVESPVQTSVSAQDRRLDLQGQVVPGVVPAQVGAALLDDQPPVPLAGPGVGEQEVQDHPPAGRELLEPDEPAYVPHQEADVELARGEPAADPPGAPVAEGHHDRAQLLARRREVVRRGAAVLGTAHHPGVLQRAQPLGEEGGGHPRHPAPELVELGAAAEQLANHQGRPAFAQHLGPARDRAELSVVDHRLTVGRRRSGHKYTNWTIEAALARRTVVAPRPEHEETAMTTTRPPRRSTRSPSRPPPAPSGRTPPRRGTAGDRSSAPGSARRPRR